MRELTGHFLKTPLYFAIFFNCKELVIVDNYRPRSLLSLAFRLGRGVEVLCASSFDYITLI